MKRIKAINGYTIYQATTQRDTDNYNCEIGSYNIYLSSDIRDFGLSNSYPEYDNLDSLTAALNICRDSKFAIACALADELSDSTVQDMDLCLEIERRFDAGESVEYVRDCYDPETGILHAEPSENPSYYTWLDSVRDQYIADCHAEDDDDLSDDDLGGDLEDVLDGDLEDVLGNLSGFYEDDPNVSPYDDLSDNFYTSVALEGPLRQCLITGIGTEDLHDQIESTGLWGKAVLELGHADIEVNITRDGDRIFAEYFVCLQEDSGDWFSDGYIDRYVTIDWSAPDWQQQLHCEMRSELESYAEKRGWDVTTPFSEDGHVYAEYAAEQCPVEPEPQPAPKQERRSHASYYVIETCDSECQWLTCTVNRPADCTDEQYRKLFFRKVAERVAFADCGDESIDEIVFDGEHVEYVGWQPGMLIEFRSCETGEIVYSGSFPEWDH